MARRVGPGLVVEEAGQLFILFLLFFSIFVDLLCQWTVMGWFFTSIHRPMAGWWRARTYIYLYIHTHTSTSTCTYTHTYLGMDARLRDRPELQDHVARPRGRPRAGRRGEGGAW